MITDTMIILAIMVVLSFSIYHVFKPERCPKCGHKMYRYYIYDTDEKFLECPKCGHRIGGNYEGSN